MTAATTRKPPKSSRLPSAELPRDDRGLDILDRVQYRMTRHVVAAVGNMRGRRVQFESECGSLVDAFVGHFNVDGTVDINRPVRGVSMWIGSIHWSKIPALVEAWKAELEAAKCD